MKQKHLWLMCGAPGSGKSYYAHNAIANGSGIIISRDVIRYKLLRDGDDYFSKEDIVWATFIEEIKTALIDEDAPENIYVDATHLNEQSRHKVLNNFKNYDFILCAVYVRPPLKTAIQRNNQRTGREKVPENVIRNMYNRMTHPKNDKHYTYEQIIEVRD